MTDEHKTKPQLMNELNMLRQRVVELEAAQVEAERQYRSVLRGIFERMTLGVHLYDLYPDGRLIFAGANPAADRILGVDHQQFIGQTIEEAFPPLAETEVPVRYRLAAAEGIPWETEQITFAHGEISGAFQVCAVPVWPGSMAALFLDITVHKCLEATLRYHNQFLKLIADISARFITLPAADITAEIQHMLQLIGEFMSVDRSYVFLFAAAGRLVNNIYEWCAPGIEPQIESWQPLPFSAIPQWTARLEAGEVINIPQVADLPPEAQAEREILEGQSIQSVLAVPINVQGNVIGFIVFDSVRQARSWSQDTIALARMVSDIVSNALSRHQAEAALRESEAQYRTLIEQSNDAIYLLFENRFELINSRFGEMFGITQEEARAPDFTFFNLVAPSIRPKVEERIKKLREGDDLTPYYEFTAVDKAGHEIEVEVSSSYVPYRGGAAICGIVRDISERVRFEKERQQAEAALRQERDLSKALADAAAAVSRTLDPDEVLDRLLEQVSRVVPNDATNIMLLEDGRVHAVRWRGYQRFGSEAFISTVVLDLAQMVGLRQMAESGEPIVVADVDTDPDWVRMSEQMWLRSYAGAPIRTRGGAVLGFLNVDSATPGFFNLMHADILRAFADHAAVALENARLYREIRQELAERKRLETQLVQAQKMEAVGRLAGGVAHDFNNQLTAIHGYAEMLLAAIDPHDPRCQDIREIQKAADRSAALTRQLLAFSRKQIIQPRVLDLNSLVENTRKMLGRLIGEDIELVITLAADLGQIKADPGQIEQVIMNLAVNARDAIQERRAISETSFAARLAIATANVEIDQAYADNRIEIRLGSYVMLSVSDNGTGMDQETMSHLFEPFFTTKEQGRGTGLGLATVYGIVKQNEGYVYPYSEPGMGSIFRIYLPRIDEKVADKTASEVLAEMAVGSETILLVEDEDSVRALARRILTQYGYHILEAANADEALLLCKRHMMSIRLVLTDVVVPGVLSSKEMVAQIIACRPEIQVIYMSGYTDDVIVHHGVLESGIHFIQKPFTPNTLAHKVRQVLDASGR